MELNCKDYEIRFISKEDEELGYKFFLCCNDFFQLTENRTPQKGDFIFNLEELPPDKSKEDKYVFGVFHNSEIIAIVDMVRDFPEEKGWIIGLFLIHPAYREKGFGKELHGAVKLWVKKMGGEKLWIGVVEDNIKGYGFWRHIGYEEVKRTGPKLLGKKENVIIVMNYEI